MGSNKLKYGDDILLFGGASLSYSPPAPSLPSHTVRCKFTEGYTPTMGDSRTLVDATENIWDIYKASDDWSYLLSGINALTEVVDFNAEGITSTRAMCYGSRYLTSFRAYNTDSVTDMESMFLTCTSLTYVDPGNPHPEGVKARQLFSGTAITHAPQMDLSRITHGNYLFDGCRNLVSLPAYNFDSLVNGDNMFSGCIRLEHIPQFSMPELATAYWMFYNLRSLRELPVLSLPDIAVVDYMFNGCVNVESGITAMYEYLSSATYMRSHTWCFHNCGVDTVSGAAELELIPNDWK